MRTSFFTAVILGYVSFQQVQAAYLEEDFDMEDFEFAQNYESGIKQSMNEDIFAQLDSESEDDFAELDSESELSSENDFAQTFADQDNDFAQLDSESEEDFAELDSESENSSNSESEDNFAQTFANQDNDFAELDSESEDNFAELDSENESDDMFAQIDVEGKTLSAAELDAACTETVGGVTLRLDTPECAGVAEPAKPEIPFDQQMLLALQELSGKSMTLYEALKAQFAKSNALQNSKTSVISGSLVFSPAGDGPIEEAKPKAAAAGCGCDSDPVSITIKQEDGKCNSCAAKKPAAPAAPAKAAAPAFPKFDEPMPKEALLE